MQTFRRSPIWWLAPLLAVAWFAWPAAQGGAFDPTRDYDLSGIWRWTASNPLVFEGSTDDANETTFSITDPTADRTITVPNVSGTLAYITMAPVDATAATLTVTAAAHSHRVVSLNRAAGVTVTLPAATGTGDVYTFVVVTAATSNQHRINVTGDDAFFGGLFGGNDTDNSTVMWPTASDADQINWNGTTTGGFKGARLILVDSATDVWSVIGWSDASGTEATPFATGQVS